MSEFKILPIIVVITNEMLKQEDENFKSLLSYDIVFNFILRLTYWGLAQQPSG